MESESSQPSPVVEAPAPATAEVQAPSAEGIQPGLADRANALAAVNQTKENLGQVAARQEFTMDVSGNIETPSDSAQRQADGGKSANDTPSRI